MHKHNAAPTQRFSLCLFALALIFLCQTTAQAAEVTLAWDANNPTPEGYKLFRRIENGSYDYQAPVWTGTQTTCTLTDLLLNTTYHFVVRAYKGEQASADSNEVDFILEAPSLPNYTITSSAQTGGSISPSGAVTVEEGKSLVFSISAAADYVISDVLVDGRSQGAAGAYTFSDITSDHTISACFSPRTYTISASAKANGYIAPSGSLSVVHGGSQAFSITAETGYSIEDVLVDGVSVGAVEQYSFENVQSAHTIEANFALDNKPPKADAGPDQTVEEKTEVRLNAANSFDLDNGIAAFVWRQLEGPAVALSAENETEVTFTAPETGPQGQALVFELEVTDYAGAVDTDTCIVNVVWVNEPPTAKAGADQTVDEGQTVILDGSNSVDPDQDIVSYHWQQISGPVVELTDSEAFATSFISPDVGLQGASLLFQLIVTDSGGLQDTDICIVSVTWINTPPQADAGPDQELVEGTEGVLDGSNSRDADDGIAAYQWTQTDGPPVLLSDATAITPSFTAPQVGPQGVTLSFRLTIFDHGGLQNQDTCHINVLWENKPPQASAGPDQTVNQGSQVQLDGSGSMDPDDGIAAYQWSQDSGPAVRLSDPQAETPTFTAPDVGLDGAALSFTLTVVDNGGLKAEDTCLVNVAWQNQPPVAQAGPDAQVDAEQEVTLNGAASYDSDDGIESFRWKQISGPPVSLDNPTEPVALFQAPAVDTETNLVFKLTVTDFGGLQGTDNCSILVLPPAAQPDTVPPEIQVTEPGRGFIFTTSTRATVRGTAWDDRQVDRIEWSSNQGYSGAAQGTGNWEIVDLQLSPWMNQITLTAYDTAGNSRSVQLKIFAIIWP